LEGPPGDDPETSSSPAQQEQWQATCAWLCDLAPDRFDLLEVDQLASLRELDLSRLPLQAQDLELLAALPMLQSLNLRSTGLVDADLDFLAGLTQLRSLDLGVTLVTDSGLERLQAMSNLEKLSLTGTAVSDAGLAHLQELSKLRDLRLEGTAISAEGLRGLVGLPLSGLGIGQTAIGDLGLAHLRNFDLKDLSLYRNTQITAAGTQQLEALQNLESLNLRGVDLEVTGFAFLAELKSLRKLNASLVMTDAALAYLSELTQLEQLGLYSNPELTDRGVEHLRNLKALHTLQLQFTGITDQGLTHLENLPRLRSLDLRGTGVSAVGKEEFAARHPRCRVLR
jgi:hypothetical protein